MQEDGVIGARGDGVFQHARLRRGVEVGGEQVYSAPAASSWAFARFDATTW